MLIFCKLTEHGIRMADNQQQNGSQQFENTEGQQQQQHLNGSADNSSTNNDSGQFECVRDDDRSEKVYVHLPMRKSFRHI